MSVTVQCDIAIFGGGVAGLWLLNRLQRAGYQCLLFERDALGGGQSIASQGMIHGGIKYALGGAFTGASEAIAAMPEHWRRCLAGEGDVDLRGTGVLSEHFYLWSTQGLRSRVGSFLASKLTRGRVDSVAPGQRPPVFDHPAFRGQLYRLADLVLDVPSLVRTLAAHHPQRIRRLDWSHCRFESADGSVRGLTLDPPEGPPLRISAQRYVFTAGSGNAELMRAVGAERPQMQLRPLHQVLLRHDYPHPLYAHCMGANPSPRLTVSSHRGADGRWIWYLGGDLATEGIELDSATLIERARAELAELLPWIDFGRTEWATLRIDRAEPRQKNLVKPDRAFAAPARGADNVITAWPTKLTLAPDMADAVSELLRKAGVQPGPSTDIAPLEALPRVPVATPLWDRLFDTPGPTQ